MNIVVDTYSVAVYNSDGFLILIESTTTDLDKQHKHAQDTQAFLDRVAPGLVVRLINRTITIGNMEAD